MSQSIRDVPVITVDPGDHAANERFGRQRGCIVVTFPGGRVAKCHEAAILDQHGRTVAKVVYRPRHKLPNGAWAWVEVLGDVRVSSDPPTHTGDRL